jgi:hypothetical protein
VDRLPIALGILVVLAIIFALLARGWRARQSNQAGLGELASPPADLGRVTLVDDLLYVATTRADAPLDRIAVAGLGFRARAEVMVAATGLRIEIAGRRDPVFIPKSDIRAAGRATWAIDRAVNTDGLVLVRWVLGETEVDSYFRSADPAALVAALQALAPAASAPTRSES